MIARTNSLESLEERMKGVEPDSLRYQILDKVKSFKTSWVDLGQVLYTVWKDKLYKGWGYAQFESYTAKEIGIKKPTVMKLLRSYYFLEKEEPEYLKNTIQNPENVVAIPSLEAVDTLRLAKNKKVLDEDDYTSIKKDVLENGKDVKEVKKDLTSMIRQREELDPEEAREKKKTASLRRFLGVLRTIKQEIETQKLLPMPLLKETDALIKKIEAEIT
ncbi:MAG: hypothetical protein PHE58_01140 [Candidatus Omnitrophica bacterium]|nr:hypothetical protein [Candidatus Omnitrophota bacterium]